MYQGFSVDAVSVVSMEVVRVTKGNFEVKMVSVDVQWIDAALFVFCCRRWQIASEMRSRSATSLH